MEIRTRKPDVARNMKVAFMLKPGGACLFGHAGNYMHRTVFAALVCQRKIGKKLTNNFIILCELLCGAAPDFRHTDLSPPALAAKAGF
ncbi:hypothetical protein [Rhizobium lentis]|nr:hypothetical protein [Rhizobium lentis]MBX5016205.1 hypothetical protein [Rhizobium lentis]